MAKKHYTKNMRTNVQCGLIEAEDIGFDFSIMFTEWWNGEGLDFIIDREKQETQKFDLTSSEMEHLVAAMLVSGFIDMEEVDKIVSEIVVK